MSDTARIAVLLAAALAVPALADEGATIIVTAPGGDIDGDEARTIGETALAAAGKPDLGRALERQVPGLTLSEATGNAWQAAIGWRGFSASPLQGAEQGLAVYLDGVRFNQPFGDTVLFDAIPEAALATVRLNEANPVLGRNALAGSLALETADGTSRPGLRVQVDGDSVGSAGGSVSLGTAHGDDDLLVVAEARRDRGWRRASPSRLARVLAKGRHAGDGWGIELSGLAAATNLTGNGVAPVELLAADWKAVFTRPDRTRTRFARLVAAPWIAVGTTGRIELRVHGQVLSRRSANGDLADFGPCDDDAGHLCLGSDDDGFTDPLSAGGVPVAAVAGVDDYAAFNRGRERTRAGGATLQWLDVRETGHGTRRLALGASWERARTRFGATSELGELDEDRAVTGLGLVLSSADGTVAPVDVRSALTDLALFASAELPLTSRLGVDLGLRWARNRVVLTDRIGTALNGAHRFSRINPSIELDYALGDGLRFSAGVARTSRNPTPAELSCADPDAPCTLANFFVADPPLKPVTARNWHAGVAGEAGGLNWRAGLWRADTRNDIRMIASQVRGRGYFANLGATRREGLELSARWQRPDSGWHLAGSYALTMARFRKAFALSSPANPAADEDGLIAVRRGDALPGVPRHALDAELGRSGAGWDLALRMRARAGQYLVGDEGNDNRKTPTYAVFDLTGRAALTPAISLVAELRNLLDRRYATAGAFAEINDIELAEAPEASDPRAYAPGAPRRLTVSLLATF
ncbi:TonB-dependent receptor [Novosphingobium colocasiae]|uniref:Membrane protein n=1 Tax=Novosphingobium colocasiae TaxID=1256513 RepID=A0A918UGE2_9SPHN|nr:TonB-dependent receptor [Novosphingobium colocasiae]GGZ05317.1 membrane protein [Novosphingobium colocasiae]